MPRHLIDSGYTDYILAPADIPGVIVQYAGHPYAQRSSLDSVERFRHDQSHLREVLAILRTRTKTDFSGYKKPTVLRRIQRRMGLARLADIAEYAKLLRQSPNEVVSLADDLLIHVTGFFRDPDAWETLRKRVIVPLVARREPDSEIRAWAAACSSGEEAYTLAMLLVEEAERVGKPLEIKVFATDMADRPLAHARQGVYPGGIEVDISPERLERFFDKEDGVYRIKAFLRECVVFAPQNVLQDPPFSRLDIATCRNLLIYLEAEVQQRVLALLHFGLREGGALFLGTSETVSGAEDRFELVDKEARIFRRVGPTRHGTIDFPTPHVSRGGAIVGGGGSGTSPAPGAAERGTDRRLVGRPSVATMTHRTLLEHHTPAAVTIDRDQRVLYFHGNTRPFIEQPPGEPTRDLTPLLRDGLRAAARVALQRAATEHGPITITDGWIDLADDRHVRVAVTASPVVADDFGPDFFVLSFDQREEHQVDTSGEAALAQAGSAEELRRIRDELQSTIEELQTSNEELKASNEEVTSINEELQSTNEELETSKEEMQSLNEELTTVNAQLTAKMEELQNASNDLAALLHSTDVAVVFLDQQFRIRKFTPATRELLDFIATDIGRPLSDLHRKFEDVDLERDAKAVLERLVPIDREISATNGRTYVRRVLPYRTTDNRIDGVVVTFMDITDRVRAETALRDREVWLRGQRGAMEVALNGAPLDVSLGHLVDTAVEALGPGTRAAFYLADESGQTLHHLVGMGAEYAQAVDGFKIGTDSLACGLATSSGKAVITPDVQKDPRWLPWRDMAERFNYRGCWSFPIHTTAGRYVGTLAIYSQQPRDATPLHLELASLLTHTASIIIGRHREAEARRRAEQAARNAEAGFQTIANLVPDLLWMSRPDGYSQWYNERWMEFTGQSYEQAAGWGWVDAVHPEDRDEAARHYRQAVQSGVVLKHEHRIRRHDGEYRWFLVRAQPLADDAGTIIAWYGSATDVHEHYQSEAALVAAKDLADETNRAKDDFLTTLSHELRTPLASAAIWVQILQKTSPDSPRFREAVAAIESGIVAQRTLIDDLLDSSRITTGKLRLDMRPTDMGITVKQAVDAIGPTASMKGVAVKLSLSDERLFVRGDAARLRQVVWNLMSNAVKFTPRGGRIDVALTTSSGGEVELCIADTGIGIDPKFLPFVFDKFRQSDTGTARKSGGLGLGLSISKQLIELHDGSIWASSEGPGKGSTFCVRLPHTPEEQPAESSAQVTDDAGAPTSLEGVRVLLVEDEPTTRAGLTMLLQFSGVEVTAAESVSDALQRLSESSFDALISDIGLPGEDGYSLMRSIREREQSAGSRPLPAIATTAFTRPSDERTTFKAGFNAYVAKPIDTGELLRKLRQLLRAT
ncbi:MAG: CheR family methyltransferase [Tepidisphaeraceae bacterium]